MTFRTKILFSIWGVVVSLLIISFGIITLWTRARIHGTFAAELATGAATINVHEQLQSAQLIRACALIAESPRLRAVAELGDVKTASQLLQEMHPSTQSQILILTDREGRLMVQQVQGRARRGRIIDSLIIDRALRYMPTTEVRAVDDRVYRMVSVPIVVGGDLVGSLTQGFEIAATEIEALKQMINCDLLLVNAGRTVRSTLDSVEAVQLLPALPALGQASWGARSWDSSGVLVPVTSSTETYLCTAFSLDEQGENHPPGSFFVLVKPLGRELRGAMGSIVGVFALVAGGFLVFTTFLGSILAKGITRPIRGLITGTDEISRGNYDYAISVEGKDEISHLARRFMEMSAALRDKMSQLDGANLDLRARNSDLDETLRQLRATQEKLVRSERLAVAGKMTAQLAHEINNPIHNIQSLLKTTLRRIPDDAPGRDLIGVAYEEVDRLSRLTMQMLNFYRTSTVEEHLTPAHISPILEDVAALVRSGLDSRKISLTSEIEDGLPPVPMIPDKIKQVMLNLVANAQDAMPDGGTITISARRDGHMVRIVVRDSGQGIAPENLEKIFDAFFTTKGKVSGVGLGLTVCHAIITQHHGSMDVESAVGRGTTVHITLPIQGEV
jgi:signal transduction histidine kinase